MSINGLGRNNIRSLPSVGVISPANQEWPSNQFACRIAREMKKEKLKEGWPLVTNEKLSREFDLSFNEGY